MKLTAQQKRAAKTYAKRNKVDIKTAREKIAVMTKQRKAEKKSKK